MSSMIRIVVISPTSILFGAEQSLLSALGTMDRSRYEFQVVTMEEGPFEDTVRNKNIKVSRLPWLRQPRGKWWSCRSPISAVRFARWLRAAHVDIVWLNLYANFLPVDLGMLISGTRFAGAKFILRHRVSGQTWLPRYDKFWLARADGIFSVSQGAIAPWLHHRRSDLWSRIDPRRVHVIPSNREIAKLTNVPYDRARVRALGIPDDAKLVGIVGAIDRRKRQDLFLRAAAIVRRRDPMAWFLIVGAPYEGPDANPAYEQSLHQFVKDSGLTDRVVFTGYRTDAAHLIRLCDVLVLPSKREASGGVLVEAMALGVPGVASNVDGIPETMKDGETGLLVASDAPQDYATAILRLLTDRKLARQMGEQGKIWAQQFDSVHVSRRIERCLDELTGRDHVTSPPAASTRYNTQQPLPVTSLHDD